MRWATAGFFEMASMSWSESRTTSIVEALIGHSALPYPLRDRRRFFHEHCSSETGGPVGVDASLTESELEAVYQTVLAQTVLAAAELRAGRRGG
jgi:hypothetical protein